MAEANFQSKVAKHLRQKGCFVIVISAGPGVPDGTPDVIALCDGGAWLALETKAKNPYRRDGVAKKGAFRPLQIPTIQKLNSMYYSRAVWPEIWDDVKEEIDAII